MHFTKYIMQNYPCWDCEQTNILPQVEDAIKLVDNSQDNTQDSQSPNTCIELQARSFPNSFPLQCPLAIPEDASSTSTNASQSNASPDQLSAPRSCPNAKTCNVNRPSTPPMGIDHIDEQQINVVAPNETRPPPPKQQSDFPPNDNISPHVPQQANAMLAVSNTNSNQRNCRHDQAQQEPTKPNMVQIFVEKLVQTTNYCHALIDSRNRWKTMEIEEKLEARAKLAKNKNFSLFINRRGQGWNMNINLQQ